jgi:hypothetical protein
MITGPDCAVRDRSPLESLLHEVRNIPGGPIRQFREDLVPVAFVERTCLKSQGLKEDALAPVSPGLVICGLQEPLAVALAAERLCHPEEREVEPASPHVPERAANHRVAIVSG